MAQGGGGRPVSISMKQMNTRFSLKEFLSLIKQSLRMMKGRIMY
ncbi:hypothetical protein EA74_01525 [Enterococcus hirae]|uniref:Uncharacterized protein n=1 Tax=Enterococcus hirae TaxID=1354 RepID=A0AB37ICU5_ENTHR|nr:hypothetical protein EA74_01525 [Enterococcus hirae]RBT66904.1 hypothetical protein EA82_02468 [Enterococcus hirae]RBT70288.1 hypothetical protein EB03_00137 [Enterococcus hirae]